jgi:iron complex outermembrane recepter protein
MKVQRVRDVAGAVALSLGLAGMAMSGRAIAQAAPATSQSGDSSAQPIEEVVVTGSRLSRLGFSAPTPVTVVNSEQLKLTGAGNVADALNQLPAFRPQTTPMTAGFSQSNLGSQILDLRGLGAQRTLVLVDGRRFVPSTTQGTFDINLIPSSLIDRTEIVTGGASAAYGSDAVAGVVNLILDTKLEGLRGEVQYGASDENDNKQTQVSFAAGSSIFDGRGHMVFAGEFVRNEGTGGCFTRSWCSPDGTSTYNVTTNPGGPGANGMPATVMGLVHNSSMTPAGLIVSGPLRGTQFANNGSVSPTPFQFGTNATPVSLFMLGGDGENYFNRDLQLNPPVKRFTLFQHATYDFTDSLSGFVEGSYGQVDADAISAVAFDSGSLLIKRDNPYLPSALATQMDSLGVTQFNMGRVTYEPGFSMTHALRSTYRFAFGLDGKFGEGWSWDSYFQYGETRNSQSSTQNKISANFTRGIDAVAGPGGTPVCRSSLTDPSNGCSPINPFGVGNISPAALAYAFGTASSVFDYKESVGAANLRGAPFSTWAGPVSTAVGVEYRDDQALGTADPISSVAGFYTNNAAPIDGRIKVLEGYFETAVPLLTDVPFAKDLELNGAVRRTHYDRDSSTADSTTVDATTWKAGAVWSPIDLLRFRVTKSRDIRAPNTSELFSGLAGSFTFIQDPVTSQAYNVRTFTGGNPQLEPEKADTLTAGVVIHPPSEWIGGSNLNVAVDYFDIDLSDAVAQLGGQLIVNRCVAGNADYCQFVTRDPTTGLLTQLFNRNLNLNSLKSKGIDIDIDYSFDLASLFEKAGGRVGLRALATRTYDLTTIDSTGFVTNRAGQNGAPASQLSGVPTWVVDLTLSYQLRALSVYLQTHSLSGGVYNATALGPRDDGYSITNPASINNNWVAGRNYVNLAASYDITKAVQLFGSVTNLFDSNPPVAPSSVGGFNPVLYDPIGRQYHLGARVKF